MGYIKHLKFIVLVDSGSTHNFIHNSMEKETHCFAHPKKKFQIIISNVGMMKYGGGCEKFRLQMGDLKRRG
jgi:hypothetical protein